MGEKIQSYGGEYLGGHVLYSEEQKVSLSLSEKDISVNKITELLMPYRVVKTPMFTIPLNKIREIKNTSELKNQPEFGLMGVIWQKRETYLVIFYNDGIQEQSPTFKMDNLEKAQIEIYQALVKVKQSS